MSVPVDGLKGRHLERLPSRRTGSRGTGAARDACELGHATAHSGRGMQWGIRAEAQALHEMRVSWGMQRGIRASVCAQV